MKYIGKGIKKGIKIGKTYLEAIDTGLPRIKKRKPTSRQIAETKKRNKAREQEQSKEGKFRADFDKSVDKRIKKEGREPYRMARHDEKVRESAKKAKGTPRSTGRGYFPAEPRPYPKKGK